jgi:hypothetical protein
MDEKELFSPVKSQRLLGEVDWGGMDWITLTLERHKWRAFVNTVMDLRVP